MIYTISAYDRRRADGAPFTGDDAQTVASWWYAPDAPALVTLATRGQITPDLDTEVRRELAGTAYKTTADLRDLRALLRYIEETCASWTSYDTSIGD